MVTTRIFQFWGYALSAINARNDKVIQVLCPEFTPLIAGEPNTEMQYQDVTLFNQATGEKYSKLIGTSMTIAAEYFGAEANQDVPDIHKGEQVLLFCYAGLDKFYWLPLGRNNNKRLTEHYRISVADKQKNVNEPLTDNNTYFLEIDTKYHKHVRIMTSNSDGEKFRYVFLIDAVTNTVILKDDANNEFLIESENNRVKLSNSKGSYVDLVGETIKVFSKANVDLETPIFNVKTTTTNIEGATNVTGVTKITGNTTIVGNQEVNGNIHATGSITAPSGSLG